MGYGVPSVERPPDTLLQGSATVVTAGTRVQLSTTSTPIRGVLVTADASNTGLIYVGNASVSSTAYGKRLSALDDIFIAIDNLNKVYLDASADAQVMRYLAVADAQ